jgi:hypothetical protein
LTTSPPLEKSTTPVQIVATIVPIVNFVAAKINEDDPQRKVWLQVAEAGKKFSGKDRIKLTSSTDGPSLSLRLDVEENVIRLVAEAQKIAERAKSGGEEK